MLDLFGSKVGRWTVYIPPLASPRLNLHLFVRRFPSLATAIHLKDGDQPGEVVLNTTSHVGFQLIPVEEGAVEWPPATVTGPIGYAENDVQDFLQAMVNEAAKLGIRAKGEAETISELKATKFHLDDMRRLALEGHYHKPK